MTNHNEISGRIFEGAGNECDWPRLSVFTVGDRLAFFFIEKQVLEKQLADEIFDLFGQCSLNCAYRKKQFSVSCVG